MEEAAEAAEIKEGGVEARQIRLFLPAVLLYFII